MRQVLDAEGKPGQLDITVAFEVTTHPAPEMIVPFPEGTVGIRSDDLPIPGVVMERTAGTCTRKILR